MLEQRHLEIYRDLFIHRRDLYAQQTPKGSYFLRERPVTDEVIRRHLMGEFTAGWYALAADNTVRWVVLDADKDNGLDMLQDASAHLRTREISSHLELSRRGGHLWILFERISASVARRLILGLLPDLDGIEVFPKRDRLDGASRVGNLVRGPLGIHRVTGQRYGFVEAMTLRPIARSDAETLEYLDAALRITPAFAAEQLARLLDEAKRPASLNVQGRLHGNHTPSVEGIDISELKERIGDLRTFVAQYVQLDEAGRGPCPFHPPDNNPSFAVHPDGFFVCFHEINPRTGRYVGGDAIEFYRRLKGISAREAVRELASLVADRGHDRPSDGNDGN